MIRLLGSENRMPFVPAVSNNEPIEAACPTTRVETAGFKTFITGYLPSTAMALFGMVMGFRKR